MIRPIARYQSPPLDEVASGVIFPSIAGLRLPHFGLFWHDVIRDFPRCEHAAPIGIASQAGSSGQVDAYPLPWPRIWLISLADDKLIQLQQDRFYFNWRSGKQRASYTSYATIYAEFEEYWGKYLSFLAQQGLTIPAAAQYELTYINSISKESGWTSLGETSSVLRFAEWSAEGREFLTEPPSLMTWSLQFKLKEAFGFLNVNLGPTIDTTNGTPMIRMELSCKGPQGEGKVTMSEWFDVAHEAIVRAFGDLTTQKAQFDVWKRGNHA